MASNDIIEAVDKLTESNNAMLGEVMQNIGKINDNSTDNELNKQRILSLEQNKVVSVKPWVDGETQTDINQGRRYTDSKVYLPKTVPVVMRATGPDDDSWQLYTPTYLENLATSLGINRDQLGYWSAGEVLTSATQYRVKNDIAYQALSASIQNPITCSAVPDANFTTFKSISADSVAQSIVDQNGKDWFIDEGFLVVLQPSTFIVKAGAGYVSGNRIQLDYDRVINVTEKPSFIYVDAYLKGPVAEFDIVVSADEKEDYTDGQGVKHFVCKTAQVLADGSVSDLRPEGEGASRNWARKEEYKQTSMFSGQHDFIVGAEASVVGWRVNTETALQVNDFPNIGKNSIYEIFPAPTKDTVLESLNLSDMSVVFSGGVHYLRDLTKPSSDPVSWGADPTGHIESSRYFKRAVLAGVALKRNSGTFLLEAEVEPFKLHPDSDLSGCELVCNTIESGETHERKKYILQISQDSVDVTNEFDVTEMVNGQTQLTNPNHREGFLFFTSDRVQMLRNDDGVLSPVYRKEANMINKEGILSYAMYLVFYTSTTKVIFKPYLDSAKCKLPKITVKGKIRAPVKCSRNNIQVQVAVINVDLLDGIFTPIERVECCNVTVSQLTFPKSGQVDSKIVAYPAIHNGCCALVYEGLTTITGWGGIDGNYTRDILVKDSHVKKVSAHAFCADIKTINSTIYDRSAIHGYGYYQIYDSKISHRGKGYTSIVETRQDFMSSWDGIISIKRSELDVEGAIDEIRLVQSLPPKYSDMPDGENYIPGYEPTVQIDDITINVNVPVVIKYTITGLYLGSTESSSAFLDKKYLPRDKNYINNITVNSKSKVFFRPIENNRDYSAFNVYSLSLHDKLEYEFLNWSASRYYTVDNIYDSGLYGIDTYTFGVSRIPQSYFVENCNWVNVLLRTPNKVDVTISGGKTLGVRASNWAYQPSSSVIDSLVTFAGNVYLVDPESDVGGDTVLMPIHCESVVFQHGSYFHGKAPVSDVYLGRYGFHSQVVYMSKNCCIRRSLNQDIGQAEKTKQELIDLVTNGYKNSAYFDA